jgi:hypothetical protein
MNAPKPKRQSKGDVKVSNGYDRCQTPPYALQPLLPYLKPSWTIWEPAAGEGHLVRALKAQGFSVAGSDLLTGDNFFDCQPFEAEALVTNPPYSVKYLWLARCYELELPFALLVPLEMIGAAQAQVLMRRYGAEIILMDKRVDFKMEGHTWVESSAQFPVIWLTFRLNIGSPLTYATLDKPSRQVLAQWDAQMVQHELFEGVTA